MLFGYLLHCVIAKYSSLEIDMTSVVLNNIQHAFQNALRVVLVMGTGLVHKEKTQPNRDVCI